MHLYRENVIVRIQGGLGNQLFQYAAGKSLSLRLGVQLILDLNWYIDNSNFKFILNRFHVNDRSWAPSEKIPKRIRTALYKLSGKIAPTGLTLPVLKDIDFEFNYDLLSIQSPVLLDGYWQNESYFKEHRKELLELLTIKGEIDSDNNQLLNKIKNSNSICIHIRRGDYITNSNAARINGVCSKDYYFRAFNILSMHIESPICFVFSDDPEWVKSNLEFDCETIFVDINSIDKPEFDFLLMKSCKYFIIANSTFSWWAAWLANYKNKQVIAPKVWFLNQVLNKNMHLPESWIRI